jgi:hypothetical protein
MFFVLGNQIGRQPLVTPGWCLEILEPVFEVVYVSTLAKLVAQSITTDGPGLIKKIIHGGYFVCFFTFCSWGFCRHHANKMYWVTMLISILSIPYAIRDWALTTNRVITVTPKSYGAGHLTLMSHHCQYPKQCDGPVFISILT